MTDADAKQKLSVALERIFEWKWAVAHRLGKLRRAFFPHRMYHLETRHSNVTTNTGGGVFTGPHWKPPTIWRWLRRGR